MTITFFVPGIPAPQGSKRATMPPGARFPRVIEDNEKTKPWRADVKVFAMHAMGGRTPHDGPVKLSLVFRFPPTKAAAKHNDLWKTTTPDIDKLERAVLDAMTGVIFTNDSRVCHVSKVKQYDAKPGLNVVAELLED